MRWAVEPRFDYGQRTGVVERRGGHPVVTCGRHVLALEASEIGDVESSGTGLYGTFTVAEGDVAVLALSAFCDEPLAFSHRDQLLARIDETGRRWASRMARCDYDGPWREAVHRSALALDLLIDDQTGAVAAAATMGLPERIGGPRNYDYRYAWLRDGNLTLEAMQRLGFGDEVHVALGWILRTIRQTSPRLRPMYRLDGRPRLPDEPLDLTATAAAGPSCSATAPRSSCSWATSATSST